MTSKTSWSCVLLFALCTVFLIPIILPSRTNNIASQTVPNPSSFPFTLPFEPIVSDPENPVGNITITNITLSPGYNVTYGNMSLKWYNATFNQTYTFARTDTSTPSESGRSANIYISWFEYIEVNKSVPYVGMWYNYTSSVPRAQLESVEFNNTSPGWGNLALAPASWYEYSFYGSRNILNISLGNMNSNWNSITKNATELLRIKFSYQISITLWQVVENSTASSIPLPNISNTIESTYFETFRIYDSAIIAGNLNATLAYVPFYTGEVHNVSLWTKEKSQNNYWEMPITKKYNITSPPNNMTWVTNTSADYRVFFNATFVVSLERSLNLPNIYAVDRLASENTIREHWYYLNVSAGPTLLRIKNLNFTDTNVAYRDSLTATTYFGRNLMIEDNNVTLEEEELEIEINNGTNLITDYFVAGETDVLMLSYRAESNLTILITDQLKTPVPGAAATLYRDGIRFGSYLSLAENFTQPSKIADARGIVVFPNLPSYGNYSIRVDYAGNGFGYYSVDVTKNPNILTTSIPHDPTWIISWISFCSVIFIIGFLKYKTYRNVPET